MAGVCCCCVGGRSGGSAALWGLVCDTRQVMLWDNGAHAYRASHVGASAQHNQLHTHLSSVRENLVSYYKSVRCTHVSTIPVYKIVDS